ncbi:hypothetical protein DFH27DRAFT_538488 [Peziza echinospora]|nr:hypothetical protein DFH27DRAFT_538488 [Peziza echinospora]
MRSRFAKPRPSLESSARPQTPVPDRNTKTTTLTDRHLPPAHPDTMVLIGTVNVQEGIHVLKALRGFYGIGPNVASVLCSKLSIHKTATVGSLSTAKTTAINLELTKLKIENDLRRKIQADIQRLRDMGSYRGRRHAMGLPVRGQNTRSQIKTARKLNRVERLG